VARLEGTNGLAVDASGRIFAWPAGDLPAAEGWTGRGSEGDRVDGATTVVLRAFASFPARLRERTERIVVGPPLILRLKDGTEVRFGTHYDLTRKARVALAVLDAERGTQLAYVDVRAPTVPVSRRRDPATPAPASPPPARTPQPEAPPQV
jgi:hypothetical protein